jgi:diguanylate cyclase (GGDEF)-like protein
MELKAYLRILRRWWWVLALSIVVTFSASTVWTSRQPLVYETKSTFVIRPRAAEVIVADEFVRTLDMLSRRVEINTTFAEVANSKLIRRLAISSLNLSSEKQSGLSVDARVIGGTNILEIKVQGRYPDAVRDFASAVGVETVNYVQKLYDVFQLEPLDGSELPVRPISPNQVFNQLLGGLLGLSLGIGLVFLLEYLRAAPPEKMSSFNILNRETGAYNKAYFMFRLWQEMSRAKRNKYELSVGLLKLEMSPDTEDPAALSSSNDALRLVKAIAERTLREEDILAYVDNATFALLLPDTAGPAAIELMERLKSSISEITYEDSPGSHSLQVQCVAGAAAYQRKNIKQEKFFEQAQEALEQARRDSQKEVVLYAARSTTKKVTAHDPLSLS